mgnify:CR=1 FL=1
MLDKQYTNSDSVMSSYFSEISRIPLLTREEEIKLAVKAKNGNKAAKDKLVTSNLKFVIKLAKQYQNLGLDIEDLISEGNLGLIEAVDHFNPEKGFRFLSYAVWWIRQAILQAIADQSRIVRLPLNQVGTINKIKKERKKLYWEKQSETMPREELFLLQAERLQKTIINAQKTSFYRRLFARNQIDPEKIKSPEDLKVIPLTTKADLREGFPFDFLAVPLEEVVRLHSSSGTTGTPTVIYYTASDLDRWTNQVARSLYAVGMRKNDVFQNMMSYGLFTGGLGMHYGAERLGALTIPIGTGNSKRQIWFLKFFKSTAIHIIPSYALLLAQLIKAEDLDPRQDFNIHIMLLGAEPHSEETRRRIEEIYGAKAYNSYGLSEVNGPGVAFECVFQEGMHLWEDYYILEILNPQTLSPTPPGEVGEIVLTTIYRDATPLIRYRTGDFFGTRMNGILNFFNNFLNIHHNFLFINSDKTYTK